MKASVRWLRELCPSLPADPGVLAKRLTSAGLEVEAMIPFGVASGSCVVVSVVSTRPHPTRGALQLVTVDRGGETLEVVCGAANVPAAGGLVVLAPLGAHLPAKEMTVEKRAIAGVTSEGMLCSEAELGLSDDASGILILPPASGRPGMRLSEALPESADTILEIGLTPNRPDGLGHLGLARELAALFELPFEPAPGGPASFGPDLSVRVTIEDADRCPAYGAALVSGVTVKPSPPGVRWRLSSLGVRAISNVVDMTNVLMLLFGHPLHAFDLGSIRQDTIVVRRARPGEKLRTLDGIDRVLDPDDLVICDGGGPVALAGVMGGGPTEITQATQSVLVECATFDPTGVRRASRRHGLHTESSHRFERGIDWADTPDVLASAVALLCELADGRHVSTRIVEARKLAARSVALRHARLGGLLGSAVDRDEARSILGRLGFGLASEGTDGDTWTVPSFRPDVSREVDLIEEVGRVRGYDRIPTVLPRVRASRDASPRQKLLRRIRETAVGAGLSEAVTYSFVASEDLAALGAPAAAVTLRNPLSEQNSVMRTTLLVGLLRTLEHAGRHGERSASLFTAGAVFLEAEGPLPEERSSFAAVLSGDHPEWLAKRSVDVWDAKGLAEAMIFGALRRRASVVPASPEDRPPRLHPRGAAWVTIDDRRVGSLGPLHPDLVTRFDVPTATMILELDLDTLLSIGEALVTATPLPRFPSSSRDMAVVVRASVRAGDVELVARTAAAEMAERVELFDRFEGGNVPEGHVSLALRVVYRAPDRTLTDLEIDARHARVVSAVEAEFKAALRA